LATLELKTKQAVHRDRWAWGTHLKDIEPQFNTIWAISDFTKENGATQVCPGSLDWPDDYEAKDEEIGYSMGGYALGYYTPPLAPGEGPESVPPEYALGHTETAISTLGSADLLKSIRDEIKGEKQTA
jgi:hypothetical protein